MKKSAEFYDIDVYTKPKYLLVDLKQQRLLNFYQIPYEVN
jgi:hypothetical protein